ncbi:HAD family hydrolase [Algibacter amylolyticus]|uniref:phosphoglycolate phosphatase n=1 Tax=Algibacter amylolyticus TaxID=1608400 RepID=A0A5M7B5C0_9FLAO|nr:HAD family hydrolase [Algibacter amylolyticus]KAA5823588.1 HAD family hydrolase [Algibacter amylolyticus]MBB5267746.1 phosphoglycolate phosphatase [Algibacter amylolyticus]TSJ74076.1 HAD family hydrolase [Algibacter amylolyticus]
MSYKAVIFDLDGTLVNSIEDIADAMNSVLKSANYPTHSYQDYNNFVGSGIKSLVTRALPNTSCNAQQTEIGFTAMMDIYTNNCINKTKPYDGITALLEALKARKLKLSILSNKEDTLTKKVALALLPSYFESVDGLTTEAHKKPNPIKALEISKNLGIKPEDIIFVGDSDVDIQTANNANMYAVGVSWGFRKKEELIANGAKLIIDHPLELIEVL